MVLLLASVAAAADPGPPADPLPEGATVRFGTSRHVLTYGPHVGMIGPKFTEFLVPTTGGGVRRYNLATGKPLTAGALTAGRVVVSADGMRATVARAGAVSVVDVATGKRLGVVRPPAGLTIVGVPGVSLSTTGAFLAFAARDGAGTGAVVVWDVDNEKVVARVETVQTPPVQPLLSPDGSTLVTHAPPPSVLAPPRIGPEPAGAGPADAVRTAQVWDVATEKERFRARVTGNGGVVMASAFAPDGSFLALSAGDGPVDLFDPGTGKRTQTLLGRKAQGVYVAVAPDGKTVASVGPDFRIQRWSADGKALEVTDPPPGLLAAPLSGLQFVDNEKVMGWSTTAQFAVAWAAPVQQLLTPASDHISWIWSTAYPAGGKDLITSGGDGRINRWDLASGAPLQALKVKPAQLPNQPRLTPQVTLSVDGALALGNQAPIEVFDLLGGGDDEFVIPPAPGPGTILYMASPTATKVAALTVAFDGKQAGTAYVWDLEARRKLLECEVPPTLTHPSATISADGSRLIVLTHDRDEARGSVVRVSGWDLATGKKKGEVMDPHPAEPVFVAAAGGDAAVLYGRNGRLWSVDYGTGTVGKDIDKLTLRVDRGVHQPIAFAPNGKQFAVGTSAPKPELFGARVYDWPSGKLARTYQGHLGGVTTMRFTPDNKLLATGSQDTSVLLWDLAKNPNGK
jgi:WD40 repeat protein